MTAVSERRVSPRLVLLARFLLVGLSGIAVNELVYVGLVQGLAVWFVVAAIVSTQVSTTWNFLGNEMWAFSGRRFAGPAWARYVAYAGMNNALLLLRVPMLWALSDVGHVGPALSNLSPWASSSPFDLRLPTAWCGARSMSMLLPTSSTLPQEEQPTATTSAA